MSQKSQCQQADQISSDQISSSQSAQNATRDTEIHPIMPHVLSLWSEKMVAMATVAKT